MPRISPYFKLVKFVVDLCKFVKKILIVEDEVELAKMYKEKLERFGFKIFLAFTADEGLELTEKEKPDSILLDILLPVKNGIYFLREMKKSPEISSIPVLGFSNYDHPPTRKEALKLGIKEYLIKTDYAPVEIVEKIENYLR